MAFQKVELSEEERKGSGRAFKKFNTIGDTYTGVLQAVERQTANFNDGPKTVDVYVFWNKRDGEFEITPPTDLAKKLKKAMRPVAEGGMGLTPGKGHLVQMKFASTLNTGKASPMAVIDVAVDTRFTPPRGSEPPQQQQQQQRRQEPPPPTPSDYDDIPF